MNKIIAIIIAAVVAGGGFFAGMKYQQSQQPGFNRQFANGQGMVRQGGQFQGNANRQGFRPVNGEIIAQDDKSIIVKLQDGSTKIVLLSDKTTINKAAEATRNDLKSGVKVVVFGQENTDGSVTAQNIQL